MSFFISDAWAQSAGAAGGGGLELLFMMAIFFAIMYFMIIRPQQKRAKEHKSMLESLQKGDEVVTGGGLLGKVSQIGDNFIEMEVSDNTHVKIQKQAVASVMPKGTMKNA